MKISIKYDKKALFIDIIFAVVGTVMYFFPVFFADIIVEKIGFDFIYILMTFSLFLGFGFIIYGYLSVPCVAIYLLKLKYYGYVIPKNKKDYDNDLSKLPRREGARKLSSETSRKYSMQSTVFAIITLIIYIAANAWTIWYTVSWSGYNNAIGVIFFGVDLYWAILLAVFLVQRNNNKYRDDLEFTPNRKKRISIEASIIVILLLGGFCLFSKSTVQSMTKYIFRSAMSVDQNYTCDIHDAIAFEVDNISNTDYEQDYLDVYPELKEGVDITEWEIGDNQFKMRIASALYINDFGELKEKYRTIKGDAVIIAQIDDNNVVTVTAGTIRKQAKKYKGDYLKYESSGNSNEREVVR